MAVLRLGESHPQLAPRRINLGLGGLIALEGELTRTGGPDLPPDLRVDPIARAMAGPAAEEVLTAGVAALREHGVVDVGGPVDAVRFNLASLSSAPHRVRTSLNGRGGSLLAYHWVGPEVGGSLVRRDGSCVLSLFDARALGTEILDQLPDAGPAPYADREPIEVALDTLLTVAAIGDLEPEHEAVIGDLLHTAPDVARALVDWNQAVRAVLHVAVSGPSPDAPPGWLVWFLDGDGWWSTTLHRDGDRRVVTMRPVDRDDLGPALGALTAQVWA